MNHFLIAYDVGGAQARAKIASRLEKAGQRIQKSVFLVKAVNIEPLEQELHEIMDDADSLLVIRLCAHCYGGAKIITSEPEIAIFF